MREKEAIKAMKLFHASLGSVFIDVFALCVKFLLSRNVVVHSFVSRRFNKKAVVLPFLHYKDGLKKGYL